ncbi:MAG: sigma-70 family RNA polymerase sigma factor [Acidobacteriota bacterium]|nr:sigma-70 family RNA polymerase sigma factor [Acidobacteriota bacterium]MDH3529549.1 sigma-70 family RNA polymerase sigma factor [Acidobacteriota bacterium]
MMTLDPPKEITQLLKRCGEGDELAIEQLMPLVYEELHRMAKKFMSGRRSDETLQTTALIHEAFLKLVGKEKQSWTNRAHFFNIATQAMRHILIDYLRKRQFKKHGGGAQKVQLNDAILVSKERAIGLVELDEALTRLAALDERKSRVVELKYFGGLVNEEIAEVLKITKRTVIRDWQFARSWLLSELSNR